MSSIVAAMATTGSSSQAPRTMAIGTRLDLVCLGEALIDFVAIDSGVSVGEASGFLKAAGGAPANVAVGAARLGLSTAFLGAVGDDPFGRYLRDLLQAEGVDTEGLRLDPDHRTGLAFVSLAADGERSFCFFRNPSADMMMAPHDVDAGRIRTAGWFHFGSITLIVEPSRAATLHALRTAREAGVPVSYDPNLRPALWPDLDQARDAILEPIDEVDLVKVSDEEATFLTGVADTSAALEVLRQRYQGVALWLGTLGQAGCIWVRKDGTSGRVAGYGVDAVDTTGAGDAFVAALLSRLTAMGAGAWSGAAPAELSAACSFANMVASMTVTRKGAIPALPTLAEVEARLGHAAASQTP